MDGNTCGTELNATSPGNFTTEVLTHDFWMDLASVCIWTLTTLLILFLNSMCLILLHKVKGFSKATIVFLKSMTIGDLILGLCFYMPTVGVFLNGRMWPFGGVCCYIQAWVIRTALPMSGVSVLLVTIDRYIAIVHPMQYEVWMSVRRARIIACGVWIVANLYGLLTSILEHWTQCFSSYYLICTIGKFNNGKAVVTLTVMGVGAFLVIAVMYVKILVIAQRHAAHMAKHRPSVTSMASANELPSPGSPNRKSFTTVFIITTTLVIGWLPSVILGFSNVEKPSVPFIIATQIPLASVSWLNVIVYYIRNQAFQEAAWELYLQVLQYCKGCCKK
ncbi:beta-4C adrenergic receptor-like [Patiria miniata]|uniref:G-protein coupled receptors family 1 profile domain-containing protein n=1 Tax=Patiria miniata TaxID=46514 RepID=A0A913ZTP2_PATMI|nr:beta-4C adrenergic receptor-like [Patiria miniata]